MRTLPSIVYEDAKRAIERIIEKAAQMQKAVAVAIVDAHGELIAFGRMDGAALPSVNIAINKAYTAARARKPTQDIGEKVKHPEKGYDIAYHGDPRFVGWGGGVPVWHDGTIAGAVGVSGLSQEEDVSLAKLGVESWMER